MKLSIKQIIPVNHMWNVYMEDTTQQEKYYPVSGLALVCNAGDGRFPSGDSWQYIDSLHIELQEYPEASEGLSFLHTIYSVNNPNPEE